MNGLASAFVPASVLGRIIDGQASYLAELRRITTLFVLLPEHDVTHPDENVRMESLYQFQEVGTTHHMAWRTMRCDASCSCHVELCDVMRYVYS